MNSILKDVDNAIHIVKLNKKQLQDFSEQYKSFEFKRNVRQEVYSIIKDDTFIGGVQVINDSKIKEYNERKLYPDVMLIFYGIPKEYKRMGYGQKLFYFIIEKYKDKKIGIISNNNKLRDNMKNIYLENNFEVIAKDDNNTYWFKEIH